MFTITGKYIPTGRCTPTTDTPVTELEFQTILGLFRWMLRRDDFILSTIQDESGAYHFATIGTDGNKVGKIIYEPSLRINEINSIEELKTYSQHCTYHFSQQFQEARVLLCKEAKKPLLA